MERGLLAGVAAFRWAAWAWMAAVVVLQRDELEHPVPAVALLALALAVTAATSAAVRSRPDVLLRPVAVLGELAVGAALLLADGPAYEGAGTLSLGSAWPVAGVLAAGIAFGTGQGVAAGLAMGLARFAGVLVDGVDGPSTVSLLSTGVTFALAGGAAGFAASRARSAERQIASARAREEVARHLHDGVLQTLAVVQRRADDPALARLAHDQERELRAFLAVGPTPVDDLVAGLRAAAARFEDQFDARAEVVVADDLPRLPTAANDALVGAVTEALSNAGRHGGARRVVVYAEPSDDGVFCSVKDDGTGFDVAAAVEGVGLPRSIRARVGEVGGTVEVSSRPGRGTEVTMEVPS